MNLKNRIKKLASEYKKEIIEIRHHFHKHPELSFKEFNTSEYIVNKLEEYGISYKQGFVKTGITALIEGGKRGKVIALRTDMDALPIDEMNNVLYKSVNDGVMHACGHDAHMASMLGTVKILNKIKGELEGTVKIIFQPGEELLPGGAKLMIEEGALKNPVPEIVVGQHVMSTMKTGTVGFRSGMYMASTDEIYITIKGKGGHAAMPKETTNTVLIASQVIVNLQEIKLEDDGENIPTILSFGKVIANGATNIVPAEVKIEGTFRTMDEKWRAKAHAKMKEIAISTAKKLGGDCDFKIINGYPYLVNDENVTNKAIESTKEFLGSENVIELPLRMTGEDFAYYTQVFPSTFYRLGTKKNDNSKVSSQHSSTFDVDDEALEVGMGVMAWMAVSFLNKKVEY